MPKPPLPVPGVVYNVNVYRGVTTDRRLLSTNGVGAVSLWNVDDDSNRQKWRFELLPDGSYNIRVLGGVTNGCTLLSCGGDGAKVDLWTTDDNSGRQRWILEPLEQGCFHIKVKGGVNNGRVLLSCGGDGTKVDLWTTDDNSGRQQWVLVPENIELSAIEFQTSTGLAMQLPTFVSEVVVTNDTSLVQSTTAVFSSKATETSSFEQQHGFTFSISGTKNFGTPIFLSGSITMSASTTNTWTYATSQSREDLRSYTTPVNVAPGKKVIAKATVTLTKLDVPYQAIGYSKITGQKISVAGVWRGVSAGQILYSLSESAL